MRTVFCFAALAALSACGRSEPPSADTAAVAAIQNAENAERRNAGPIVETLARGLNFPWSMAFAPNGDILIVEKTGAIKIFRDGALLPQTILGLPQNTMVNSDSGLHDIALDPDFDENGLVYLAFAEGDDDANRLAVFRARLENNSLVDSDVIFRATPDKSGASHPGGRLLFLPDDTFLLTVGDGFRYPDAAQDLSSHLGKILRLDRSGQAPSDNPFVDRENARPEIWSYGHRNSQGLALDPMTGIVWEHEHGPRGGDEINRIEAGANYGWPLTTSGIDYDGRLLSYAAHAEGVMSPLLVWAPSIAPSGLAVYRGAAFPEWQGHFLVGALASRLLVRAQLDNEGRSIEESERLFDEIGARLRDVRVGPDGAVYILTDEADGRLLRVCGAC